jgi:hypothetical protein
LTKANYTALRHLFAGNEIEKTQGRATAFCCVFYVLAKEIKARPRLKNCFELLFQKQNKGNVMVPLLRPLDHSAACLYL